MFANVCIVSGKGQTRKLPRCLGPAAALLKAKLDDEDEDDEVPSRDAKVNIYLGLYFVILYHYTVD